MDATLQGPLKLLASGRADRLDHRAGGADQDALLRGGLDPDQSPDTDQVVVLALDLFDDHLDRMGHLLEGAADHRLADQLGDEQLRRLVGGGLRAEHERPLGEHLAEVGDQLSQARSTASGDREDLALQAQLADFGEDLEQSGPRELVDLVDGDRQRRAGFRQGSGDEAVAGTHSLLGVEHQQRRVGAVELLLDAAGHAAGEGIARALHAGQVDEHDLRLAALVHSPDRPASRLRAVGDDRDLLADDGVDERRLADVGTPGERDEAAAGHRSARSSSSICRASISPESVS